MTKRLITHIVVATSTMALCALFAPVMAKDKAKAKKKKEYINAYEELAKANRYAAAGAISRSIPHYLRALKADPINYSVAHYNLAEVYKAKRKCSKAGFHYQAYVLTGRDAETKKAALNGIKACGGDKWPKLTVKSSPAGTTLTVNGYVLSQSGQINAAALPKGKYDIKASAADHIGQSKSLQLGGDESVDFTLEKMTFFGNLGFQVTHKGKVVQGATINVTPKKIDKSSLTVEKMSLTTPVKKSFKLPTGKYFVEVKAKGYDRWIRNVYITRDSDNVVGISLTESLPDEIK